PPVAPRPPHPRATKALDAGGKPLRQRIRQPPFANLGLRALDLVLDAPERCHARADVEQQPRPARAAHPGLAARGSPWRGGRTEPGLSGRLPGSSCDSVPPGARPPSSTSLTSEIASGTW